MSILTTLKKLLLPNQHNHKKNSENQETINVYDCMEPLSDLVVVNVKESFDTLLEAMNYKLKNLKNMEDNNFIADFALIYNENTDDLVGIVESKDIIFRLKYNSKKDGCDFLFSDSVFVPVNMNITNALDLMRRKNSNILLVVDSKGSTLGVINKNSIIDYIYTYNETQEYFSKYVKNDSITVPGTLLLKHIPEDGWYLKEYDDCYNSGTRTIGGFLGYHTGMIPQKNTEIIVHNILFKILEGNERVVKTILMSKIHHGKI